MKARFLQPQLPVKTLESGDKTYIFLCLNETQGTETYPDMGEGQTHETYYEYDYNEISGPTDKLPIEDIQANPGKYLNYVYTENKELDILKQIEELKASIANTNAQFLGGNY